MVIGINPNNPIPEQIAYLLLIKGDLSDYTSPQGASTKRALFFKNLLVAQKRA
ncbi:MAG: hypothetical protein MI742_13180 [Desulfobacterales bacterium]|nr:hypothetical protein [Desulfobacterales bacterium]